MADEPKPPQLKIVGDEETVTPIIKPPAFSANKFKSTTAPTIANVETLLTGLPHYTIAQAKDFVRLHPDEKTYWSDELCFVNVPIKGASKESLHLIIEPLAKCLPNARVLHFRLALATRPYDNFFLCHVPTRNPDCISSEHFGQLAWQF
jgi:hypothetical protein